MLLQEGSQNHDLRALLWKMCAADSLFYFNSFAWLHEPRPMRSKCAEIPWITFPDQDRAITEIEDALEGGLDLCCAKARDQGATWDCVGVFEHQVHFKRMRSFLMVSRTEEYVDSPGNMKALFQKVDFLQKRLPNWLRGTWERTSKHMRCMQTGSSIDGESTTGEIARGDRRTGILLDEFAAVDRKDAFRALASSQAATSCRIFNSTPQGKAGAFYEIATSQHYKQLRLHWSNNPMQNAGLYQYKDGKIHFPNGEKAASGYDYILDGKLRSPWYDAECRRMPIPSLIAQELDIDFIGSGAPFFDADMVDTLRRKFVTRPYHRGELIYNEGTFQPTAFHRMEKGRLQLWCQIDLRDKPPEDRTYVIGIDTAAGTGASESVLSIGDCKTGEKVGEFASADTRPERLAEVAVALAAWFCSPGGNPAYMIWEAQGPGGQFGARVRELGFSNFYCHRDEDTNLSARQTDRPGWYSTKEGKRLLFAEYSEALARGKVLNRSDKAYQEMLEYEHDGDGSVVHTKAKTIGDPSGQAKNHGDRVVADALMCRALRMMGTMEDPTPQQAPENSYQSRMDARKSEKVASEQDYY